MRHNVQVDAERVRSAGRQSLLRSGFPGASLCVAVALTVTSGACSTRRDVALPRGSSCGSYVIPQGGYDPAEFRTQQDCLLDAFVTGEPATLSYRYPTEEGAPIDVSLTIVDQGVVEARTDQTEDRFSSGGVRMERCTDLALVQGRFELSDCVAV